LISWNETIKTKCCGLPQRRLKANREEYLTKYAGPSYAYVKKAEK